MIDMETFKRDFKDKNAEIFFMLRSVKPNAPGIEIAAFRRAKLFREQLGIEVTLVTNEYQNDLLEHCDDYKIDSRVLNMYDDFQEINRETEKPRRILIKPMHEGWSIERIGNDLRICRPDGILMMYCVFSRKTGRLSFINFFNKKHKRIRRDYYDTFGFLSCRQELDPETDLEKEIFYYRPDGTVAIHETYELVAGENTLSTMKLKDRKGKVTETFAQHDEALAYWFKNFLSYKEKNYFLIGDRTPEYHRIYKRLKSANVDNVKVIHQLHSMHVISNSPLHSPLKSRYKYLTDARIKADAFITLTEQQRDDIITRYNLSDVVAIPHSLQNFNVGRVKFNPLNVVMVGRISKEKGHAKAVAAFKTVAEKIPQAQLFFYGTGELQPEVQSEIDKLNLSRSIVFKGFTDNVAEVFSYAACSICTSTSEGFSLAVQESLQNGCPVVSFDCPYGSRDMIEDGVNGYLVKINDVEAMADRIIKILTEPGLRDKLSANCARSVEKFSPKLVASKWAELFYKLMNKSKGEQKC